MPTISASVVGVLPVVCRSTMSLAAIRQEMMARRPDLASHTGGWASTSDHQSNLKIPGMAPPVSDPELVPASGGVPETLRARFYFWQTAPPGLQAQP